MQIPFAHSSHNLIEFYECSVGGSRHLRHPTISVLAISLALLVMGESHLLSYSIYSCFHIILKFVFSILFSATQFYVIHFMSNTRTHANIMPMDALFYTLDSCVIYLTTTTRKTDHRDTKRKLHASQTHSFAVAIVIASLAGPQWLLTEEKIRNLNYNGTVNYNTNDDGFYITKFTKSSLWILCFAQGMNYHFVSAMLQALCRECFF